MSDPIFNSAPQTNPFGLTNIGSSASPTFADIDGDGDLDAFIGNKEGSITFFRNLGNKDSPNFGTEVGIGLVDPGTFTKPAFVDIDYDGDLDAFVGTQDGTVKFYQNIGSKAVPNFSEEADNFGLTNIGNYASPTFADIDGDGDMDAFVGVADGSTRFFRNTGSASAPSFASEIGNFGLTSVGLSAVPTFTDIDGDGDLDAFVGGSLDPVFFRNVGNVNAASFISATSNFGLVGTGQYTNPSFADIDGDGDLDAFVGNLDGDTFYFRNGQAGIKITPSGNGNTVTEGGATDTYTIVLNRQPTANVTITLDNTNNQVNTDKITLTFTAANWNVAQTVTLSAVNDTTGEGRHTGAIKHTVSSADTDYNGLAVKPLAVTILDNDLPKVNPSFVLAATPSGLANNGIPVASFADIDGDGDIDVFIGGTDGNTILFRNTGTSASPSFVSQSNSFGLTDVGASAAPAFADIDGDGDLDAFVGNIYGSITFFRNIGNALSPSFVSEANNFGLIQEPNFVRPAFADIDGDGDLDAFVGTGDGTPLFFRNVGTANAPSFVKQSTNLGLTSAGASASPSFADLDGDGDLDAVIGKGNGDTIYFKNIGNATNPNFSAIGTNVFGLTLPALDDKYTAPTFADLDGDGDLDALFSSNFGLHYLVNAIPGITVRQSSDSTAVTEGGATDSYTVALGSIPTANVTITLGNTNNQVNTNVTTLTFTAANWNIPQTVILTAVNDTTGEGKHTGVIKHTVTSADATYNGMVIKPIIVNITDNDLDQRNPSFNAANINPFGLQDVGYNASPTFADIDGDGDLDAFIGNKYDGIIYFKNTGSATSPAFALQTSNLGLANVGNEANPSFADIDSDGDLDAFVGNFDGNIKFFRNTGSAGTPNFVAQTASLGLADVGSKSSPTFVDIDNDGDLDAFVGKGQGGAISFFRNTGTATAAKFVSEAKDFGLIGLGSNNKPDFADWDGDGDLDAMVGDFSATSFFRNNGSKTAPTFVKQAGTFGLSNAGSASNPTLVDIDGDGDLDAFVGFLYGETAFYLNTPPGISIGQSGNSTAVTEGGATDTFTVVLDSIPKANVTITLDNTNNQVNTSKITLTFTAANWNIPQTVILTAVNDTVGEGKHNGVITYKVTSTDPDYNGMVVKPLAVTITDNDLATGNPNFIGDQINPFGLTTGPDGFTKPRFADIDGDGDLDLFAGFRYGDIQFYRNTGTANAPAFASPVNSNSIGLLGSNGGYNSPSFADIDGDGDLDAFIGGADGKLLFSRNIGSSASAPSFVSQNLTFGITDVGGYANPTFADIDNDGDLDAFIGANDGKTHFFRNIGSANTPNFIKQANNFGIADVGDSTAYPSLVDFDGDGDLDAIVGDFVGNTQFFRNVGTATAPSFVKVNSSFGIPEIGDYAHPTFVDIDGDGDLDAFVGEDGFDTPIHFLRNVSTNLVTIAQSGGSTKVAEGGANDTYTVVLKNQPTANVTITFQTNGQVSTNTANLVFTAANWNVAQTVTVTAINDGVGEGKHTGSITHVVTSADKAYQGAFSLPVVANITDNDLPKTDPNFIAPAVNPFGLTSNAGTPQTAFVDIDGDGDLDAFQNGTAFGSVQFLRNVGTTNAPSFASESSNFGITDINSILASPSFADIDRDGDMDAFVGANNGFTHFFRNTGTVKNPSFTKEGGDVGIFGLPDVGNSAKLAFADIDNDGDLDVFVGSGGGATLFFRNTGTASAPTFVSSASNFGITDNNTFARPTLTDIDGDGDLDMFVGDNTGNTQFFRNTGSASAPSFVSASGAFGISNVGSFATPTFADIDGDGDIDALVGNNDGEIRFFENTVRSSPVLTTPADIVYTDTKFDDTFATKNGTLTAADANGDPLTFGIQSGNDLGNGTIRLINSFGTLIVTKATGAYSFIANDATIETLVVNSVTNFTVTVSDGLLSSSKTLTLRINQSGTTETNGIDNLVGTAGNDKFNALAGDDTVNGGLGVDTMAGGLGNDTYVVDNISDKVIEISTLATEVDRVLSTVNHTLTANVENLVLIGGNPVNGTGNALDNSITGNGGANTLNGGLGVDTMAGGLGNDTYVVDNIADKVIETSTLVTEIDLVQSSVSFTLSANVESLSLLGSAASNGTGNNLANTIVGNAAANLLNGGLGNDILTGGLGNDIFRLTTLTNDRITDFNVPNDTIQLENAVFTQLTTTGALSTNHFKIGAATDADDHVLYNSANGSLVYDSNGNAAGGTTQIAVLGIGLALTNADFVVI